MRSHPHRQAHTHQESGSYTKSNAWWVTLGDENDRIKVGAFGNKAGVRLGQAEAHINQVIKYKTTSNVVSDALKSFWSAGDGLHSARTENITFLDLPFPFGATHQHCLQEDSTDILYPSDVHRLPTVAFSAKLSTEM